MPVHITSRADAEALIQEQLISTIQQDAPKQSIFMQLARKLPNMTSRQTRIRPNDLAYVSLDLIVQGFVQSRGDNTV